MSRATSRPLGFFRLMLAVAFGQLIAAACLFGFFVMWAVIFGLAALGEAAPAQPPPMDYPK